MSTTTTTIRLVDTQEELRVLVDVLDRVWGTRPGETMLDLAMLIALRGGGHYVSGVYAGDELVGGCIGFHVEPLGEVLHSHIAGVLPDFAAAGLGRAIKEHQREWCRAKGIATIRWTYDPLIARNAHFNLVSLGAVATKYTSAYYGVMNDGINAGDESDRITAEWSVPDAVRRAPLTVPDAVDLISVTPTGEPVVDSSAFDADVVAVRVPSDIERMRLEQPAVARTWRLAVREALSPLLASPAWESLGFDTDSRYVFTRRSA